MVMDHRVVVRFGRFKFPSHTTVLSKCLIPKKYGRPPT